MYGENRNLSVENQNGLDIKQRRFVPIDNRYEFVADGVCMKLVTAEESRRR